MNIQYFKAKKQNNIYKKGQKVWIRNNYANHLTLYCKWRGVGRYVESTLDKFSPIVGEIKTINVGDRFGIKILGLQYEN